MQMSTEERDHVVVVSDGEPKESNVIGLLTREEAESAVELIKDMEGEDGTAVYAFPLRSLAQYAIWAGWMPDPLAGEH